MTKLAPIKIPLINPNETEVYLAGWEVQEGDPVKTGDCIAMLETTKASAEICAEADGFLVGVRHDAGSTLPVGEVLAYLADSPDAMDASLPPWQNSGVVAADAAPQDLRITKPALALAQAHQLDLNQLPRGQMITQQIIQTMLAEKSTTKRLFVPTPPHNHRLIIYGAGGHGRSLIELIRLLKSFQLEGVVDDQTPPGELVLGLPVLGGAACLPQLVEKGVRMAINAVGGIGSLQTRLDVFNRLIAAGFTFPTVIHPTAFIEATALLADGVQAFPLAYVGSQVQVGFGSIINTSAIVSHDCVLGEVVNLSPGATLAGNVTVGDGALVGMRATVNLGVKIGAGARIGNGATVKADVPEKGIVPAGSVYPLKS